VKQHDQEWNIDEKVLTDGRSFPHNEGAVQLEAQN